MSDGSDTPAEDSGGSLSSRLREARDHAAQTRAVLAERSKVSTPTIFRLERFLLGRVPMPPGVSIVTLARR